VSSRWERKLASIPTGITPAELERLSGGRVESGTDSGQTGFRILRLDDYWVVTAYVDLMDTLAPLLAGGPEPAFGAEKLIGLAGCRVACDPFGSSQGKVSRDLGGPTTPTAFWRATGTTRMALVCAAPSIATTEASSTKMTGGE
jgi:hypothetical protein